MLCGESFLFYSIFGRRNSGRSVGSDFIQYGAGTLGPEKAHAPVVEDVKVK